MGNRLPLPCAPCPCVYQHEADGTAGAGAGAKKGRRKQKRPAVAGRRSARAARSGHVVPVVDTAPPEDGDGGGEEVKEAWLPGCRVETDGGVRRVKIVMKRKDIAELVARLERRDNAAERDARIVELNAGAVTMSPCRDAWRPRLSIIPENY